MKSEKSKPKKIQSFTHQPLLLEVGCEEIPARFLLDAERSLGERVLAGLREARLLPNVDASTYAAESASAGQGSLRTYSTPRRLIVHVLEVLARQPDKVEEILGPPVKVAVDAEGKFTRAAESFAQKNSARVDELVRTQTPKGAYLSLTKTTPGRPARDILAEILPQAILGLTFPKSMYWRAKSDPRFVRPIRWVLALLGEGKHAKVVEFEILGVKSGNFTFGHRSLGHKPIKVENFKYYLKKLNEAHVEIDTAKRCERLLKEADELMAKTGLRIVRDESLADWIANSTEWPRAMLGDFDERFLHLPREILITVMRDHQKYFAVETTDGNLAPHFIAGLNMDSDPKGLIRQGHQRVLTARFRDAEFFWTADQAVPLRDRGPQLERVTYQAELGASLGSYAAKIKRMEVLASRICDELANHPEFSDRTRDLVRRAVELCKCDLTTQMVHEFTELQGVVGGLYAKAQGETGIVAEAIYDQYLPLGVDDPCPRSLVGAVVSLVDKLDSVVAGFAAGLKPSGSSDPFGLRRNANGAIKVLLEKLPVIPLGSLIDLGYELLKTSAPKSEEIASFFADRLSFYLGRKYRYDTVRAVLAAGFDPPRNALARAEALDSLRGSEDLEALSAAAKRIRNILTKSASGKDWTEGDISAEIMTEPQERELGEAYGKVAGESEHLSRRHEYRQALEAISTLRPAVDKFFDKVLVMAEDPAIRQNRLRLLKKLDELFTGIAHFAEIAEKA